MLTFCTIISKNYLACARTLARSIRAHHPDSQVFALLVDGLPDPGEACEPFTLVPVQNLGIDEFPRLSFQYNILELNTAVKPYFLQYLFRDCGAQKLVYLDPDIQVFHRLDHVESMLEEHSIVLTPHITSPFRDDHHPSEIDILRAGTFNLGFLGLTAGSTSQRFLAWWQQRLRWGCRIDPDQGMLVDQKWIDLIPCYFPDVGVLKHPGYNVAYWNLHERRVEMQAGQVLVNSEPCRFMHFSGYNVNQPSRVSKYQDRWHLEDLGPVRALFDGYREALERENHLACLAYPYEFGRFADGTPIPELVRKYYLNFDRADSFADPFAVGPGTFHDWLLDFGGENLSPILEALFDARPELPGAMPDPAGHDRSRFLQWVLEQSCVEAMLGRELAAKVRATIHEQLQSPSVAVRSLHLDDPIAGVNLIGWPAEAATLVMDALHAVKVPCHVSAGSDRPYALDLVHPNALPFVSDQHSVLYLPWDYPAFPVAKLAALADFDEIWTSSTFALDVLSGVSPRPVHCMPLPIATSASDRSRSSPFRFLCTTGTAKEFERTNVLAAIEAFVRAFSQTENVQLIVQTDATLKESIHEVRIRTACAGRLQITLAGEPLSELLSQGDAVISLHRSMGDPTFLAQSMGMGRPAIATAFGGHMDFMTEANSVLVRFAQVSSHSVAEIGRMAWAEPDVHHAAEQMQRLVRETPWRRELSNAARETVRQRFDAVFVGKQMSRRLTALARIQEPSSFTATDRQRFQELSHQSSFDATTPNALLRWARNLLARLLRPFWARQTDFNQTAVAAIAALERKLLDQETRLYQQSQEISRLNRALQLRQHATRDVRSPRDAA